MPAQDYLDFELNIEALAGNLIRVTVANSPVGSVSAEVPNPLTDAEIARVIGVLDGSIQASRGEAARAARAFGEKLFTTIFSGQVYAAYLASRNQAGEGGLRIRLSLENAGELEDLPWELLRDPANDYLALSRQTPLVRYPRLMTVRPLVEVTLPLRVLVLISSPNDQDPLDVEAEWRALEVATADLRSRGLLELERLDNAQLVTLQRRLREGTSYQVFHYIGHAAFDERSKTGMLAFEDPRTQNTQPISGEALARELVEENSIRLVVLNACQGARRSRTDPFAGIASSIVARGIPAVVAMQFPITDDASRIFAAEFYRALSEGYPIEAAMSEARRAIGSSLNNMEWATPVLYLRAPNGVLFPKRIEAHVSRGGLREALLRPPIVIGMLALMVLVGGLLALIATAPVPPPPPTSTVQVATLTPTPNEGPRDVDLVVSSLRFLPPNPAPGQPVTVAIRVENRGTTDSGPFTWVWFASNPQENPTPAVQGQIANLKAGLSLVVRETYLFGWWGTYLTTAWVNFDNKAQETNIFNNLLVRTVETNGDPFSNEFTRRPSGVLLEEGPLTGDEFSDWNVIMRAEAPPGNACSAAILSLLIDDNDVNQLVTGLADDPTKCTNLPVVFTISRPQNQPGSPAVGSVTVAFFANVAGKYTLDLLGIDNTPLNSVTLDVTGANTNSIQRITVNAPNRSFERAQAVLRVPENGRTNIRQLLLALPAPQ